MRKLKPAEIKFLAAFPADYALGDGKPTLPGTLRGCTDWPKHTNCGTVRNLLSLGLIRHSPHIAVYSCPLSLTAEGKKLVRDLQLHME